MLLLVGLGNPGQKYERTRHNVGFRVAEEVARATGAVLDQERWSALLGIGRLGREQVAIVLPQTYMNASGEAVGQAARFWKVAPQDIVVVHDELDFEFGRLGVKLGGGDGGHNGLKSLRNHLGSGETIRIRVGIGRPPRSGTPPTGCSRSSTAETRPGSRARTDCWRGRRRQRRWRCSKV